MKKRVQKKRWKEQTTAQQSDLLERVAALEELTLLMTAEQTSQRERVEGVQEDLDLFRAAHASRHAAEDAHRRRQRRIQLERERERRQKRREWRRLGILATYAVSCFCLALMFQPPEPMTPMEEPTTVAVEAVPVGNVGEALGLLWQ